MREAINQILLDTYGEFVAGFMTDELVANYDYFESRRQRTGRDELMIYIWMNTTGGDTAAATADRIRAVVDKS